MKKFFAKQLGVKPTGPCIEWRKCRNAKGYGVQQFRGVLWLAHRVAWVMARGEIPQGLCVLHRCDNPACINPEHLFLGTHQDNMVDMVKKGRGNALRGEERRARKLNEAAVRDIRARCSAGGVLQRQLAQEYGVSQVLIGLIVRRKKWSHVE